MVRKHCTRRYGLNFKVSNVSYVNWVLESFPLFCISTGSGGGREGSKGLWIREHIWTGSESNSYYLRRVESHARKTKYLNQFWVRCLVKDRLMGKQRKNQILRRDRVKCSCQEKAGREEGIQDSQPGGTMTHVIRHRVLLMCFMLSLLNGVCQQCAAAGFILTHKIFSNPECQLLKIKLYKLYIKLLCLIYYII